MTFWHALKSTYSGSIAFLIACPLLALVPVAFEVLQHGIEVHIGMYDSVAGFQAGEHHPLRMAFGMLKVAALLVPGYWIARFLPHRDAAFARTVDPVAVRLYAGYLVFAIVLTALQLFGLPQTAPALLAAFVVGQVLGALLVAWAIAAALGNAAIGPRASVLLMARQVLWTFAFSLVAILPLMIPHYLFAALALKGPKALLWPVLIVDALLVGWMTAVLVASGYYAVLRAATRAGVALLPVTGTATARFTRPASL